MELASVSGESKIVRLLRAERMAKREIEQSSKLKIGKKRVSRARFGETKIAGTSE